MDGGVETYHQGVDKGVDENEHPDRSRHVAHASPHAEHSTSVMVGLESRAELALGEDDEGIEDLVEFAEIEDPTVVSQTLVPETTGLSPAGKIVNEGGVSSDRDEGARGVVVVDGVSNADRTVQTAEAISGTGKALGTSRVENTPPHTAKHTPKGPGRVDGEEDIVEDDKDLEGAGLGDGPGFLVMRLVVNIEALDGDGI